MSRSVNPRPQYFDSAGNPLVNGLMFYFESGTDTPKATFSDVNLKFPNPDPVPLFADGVLPNVWFNGTARQKLIHDGGLRFDVDPVGGDDIGANFSEWNPLIIYNTSAIVQGSDGRFYISIQDANQGNDPSAGINPAFWAEIQFINVWNPNVSYSLGTTVKGSDNLFYRSLVNDNLGNDPVSDTVNWGSPIESEFSLEDLHAIALYF